MSLVYRETMQCGGSFILLNSAVSPLKKKLEEGKAETMHACIWRLLIDFLTFLKKIKLFKIYIYTCLKTVLKSVK